MSHSNLPLIKLVPMMTIALSVALTACSLPKPGNRPGAENQQDNATYFVDKSEIKITGQTLNPKVALPVSKTIALKVCLKDNSLVEAVINHDFHVTGEGSDLQDKKLTSDKNGCIMWSEVIPYNHLADAKLVELKRSVSANGFQKGNRVVSFAINPWENVAYAMTDSEIKTAVPAEQAQAALQGTSDSKSSKRTSLWFDDLRLTVDEKQVNQQGLVLNFEIRATPSFQTIKASGQRALEQISYGEFEGELSLIHVVSENQKEVRRLLTAPVAVKGSMASTYLILEKAMTLERICTRGQLQLGLKLKAVNAPENLGAFEGVFIVNECDQIKGNSFSRLKNVFQEGQGALSIEQYLTEKSGTTAVTPPRNSSDPQTQTDTSQQDAYQAGQVEIKRLRFENVAFENRSSLQRRKTFNVQACMRVGLDQKTLRAQIFQVKKVTGETESIRSNDDGCISWDDSIDFNYLAQECWIQKTIQISNGNLGVNQNIQLNINPWTYGDSSVRDVRFLNAEGQKLKCAEGKSEILIAGYSFDKKELSYDINAALQLKVKKTGILKLSPTLKRPSLTEQSGFEQGPLPVGPYVLKYAVMDNFVKDFSKSSKRIYQTGEKLVFVNIGGVITETLTLESWNVKAMGSTNQLLLELTPAKADAKDILAKNPATDLNSLIDTENMVEGHTYSAPIILAGNNEDSTAQLVEGSNRPEGSLIDALKKQLALDVVAIEKENSVMSKKEYLAKNENLQIVNVNNEAETIPLRKSFKSPVWWYPDTTPQQKATEPVELYLLKQPLYENSINADIGNRLCAYWFFDRMRRPVKSIQVQRHPKTGKPGLYDITAIPGYLPTSFQLTTQCQSETYKNPSAWFEIQQRFFVTNVKKIEDLKTEVRDFSINTSFSMSKGHSDSVSLSKSVDAGLSISAPIKAGFLSITPSAGFRVSKSWSASDSDAYGTSVAFSSGISGTVERLAFKLRSENVEKCVVIRLKPEMYADLKKSNLPQMMDPRLTDEEKFKVLTEGLMICQGQPQIVKLDFVETYFVMNQKIATTLAIDSASEATRPFYAGLRGQRDFDAFMSFLHGTFGMPNSVHGDYQAKQVHDDRMSNAFLKGVRSYPGQYVVPQN